MDKKQFSLHWLAAASGLLACLGNLCAEELKITKATGSVIKGRNQLQTGSSSRLEVKLPFAVARLGSNANFKFSSDYRKLSLQGGTMLLSIEKTENVSVESGSIVTTLTKGALEMSNVGGRVKVITLNGKVTAALAANPSDRRTLRPGEMVDVPAGATQMPSVGAIRLGRLLKTSVLINMGPFPGLRAIRQHATSQAPPRPFVTGGFDPDSSLGQIGPTATAGMIELIEANVVVVPFLPPNAVPTQTQIAVIEAAGKHVPPSNIRAIERSGASRVVEGERIKPHPPPVVSPPPPVGPPPVATTKPVPIGPQHPIVIRPRPKPRPPIAVP